MKKLGIYVGVLALLMTSCKKEVIEKQEENTPEKQEMSTKGGKLKLRHITKVTDMVTGKVVDVHCYNWGGTCALTVVVNGVTPAGVVTIIDTENDELIRESFEENESELIDIFGSDNVTNVVAGVYKVRNLGTYAHEEGNETFIQFYDLDDNIIGTTPIILE